MNVPSRWLALALLIGLYACNKKDNVLPATTVTDIDGNVYRFVTIGKQIWMAENLKTTHYNNKTKIQDGQSDAAWNDNNNGKTGAYCWYNRKNGQPDSLAKEYGRLYNFYAVKTGNLCPIGWHVPNQNDWDVLADTLYEMGLNYTSVIMDKKWPGEKVSNLTGLSLLPNDYRENPLFINMPGMAHQWLSDIHSDNKGVKLKIDNNSNILTISLLLGITASDNYCGYPVRCVKD